MMGGKTGVKDLDVEGWQKTKTKPNQINQNKQDKKIQKRKKKYKKKNGNWV